MTNPEKLALLQAAATRAAEEYQNLLPLSFENATVRTEALARWDDAELALETFKASMARQDEDGKRR